MGGGGGVYDNFLPAQSNVRKTTIYFKHFNTTLNGLSQYI